MAQRIARAQLLGWLVTAVILASSSLAEAQRKVDAREREGNLARTASGDDNPTAEREYTQLMLLGLEEYRIGHWTEARGLFSRGHALVPGARSLRVLGMTAFNLKRYPEALRELSAALSDARRPLVGHLRKEAQELLDRSDLFVGRYRLLLEPSVALLRVDGLEATRESDGSLLLSIGDHLLEAEAPGYLTLHRPLVVDGTDGETLRVQLTPAFVPAGSPGVTPLALPGHGVMPPSPIAKSLLIVKPAPPTRLFADYRFTWISGGSALLFGGAATALHLSTLREADRLRESCQGVCEPGEVDTGKRDAMSKASEATLGAALVLAAGAIVLFFVERERRVK